MNQSLLGNLLVALPAVAFYTVACATPAVVFWNTNTQTENIYSGGHALLMGPLAVLAGQFSWFANPLFFAGVGALLLGRFRTAAILAAVAIPVAAHAYALHSHPLPANEGGIGDLQLRSFGPGFYLWISSLVTLAGSALGRHFLSR
jgi:hypothetical protein